MVRRLLFLGLALAMATTAMAATSADVNDTHIWTSPYTWDGELPLNVLLIQDQQGWGFNTHIQILQSYGVSYTVINSGQIASQDFGPFDKILTVGQQPDNYYYSIDSNRAKFETYMSEGGCCSFEIANYFGYPNEYITWPGGFMAVVTGGANSISIVDAGHPLMTTPNTVNNGELQGWNYSAHGIVSNQPAGYINVLQTNDGSPTGSAAGSFPWGNGGAAVCHMPIEWGYGFGYSPNYVPNFDLYECGDEPVATEESSWGQVKSLFR